MNPKVESWGSRLGLVLAVAGNAVGLGNYLRFPIQAIQNGGGAFIIPYIICFLVMGLPLLLIEWSMGRYGGKHQIHATPFMLHKMGKWRILKYLGVFSISTNVIVAAYYCYIESWTIAYAYYSLIGTFEGMSQAQVVHFFEQYLVFGGSSTGIPYESLVFYIACLVLNIYVLSLGLNKGIERVGLIGMPLLIIFSIILALRGMTLGTSGGTCSDCNALLGINYLWQPQYESLLNPKVWLAAAGQVFFTLAVGMGTIQCYAAYLRSREDIALNALTAGFTNEFVEVVLGAWIIIPIATGYLGLDWVKNNAGFAMAFQTMPFLFEQWGRFFGALSGMMWFGLLFFAGITSSLAMGMPWVNFLKDEFDFSRVKASIYLGVLVLLVGLPSVIFYKNGFLDEYDYWAGTVSLVFFALVECLVFVWLFGMDKGWAEIQEGADIKLPAILKPILTYVTPIFLALVMFGSLFTPRDNDWIKAISQGWEFDKNSIFGKFVNADIVHNRSYVSNVFLAEEDFLVKDIVQQSHRVSVQLQTSSGQARVYEWVSDVQPQVRVGQAVREGEILANGRFYNDILYRDLAKLLVVLAFVLVAVLVWLASQKRKRSEKRD
ncbi:MAG: sodium:calcium symporter [Cytophagales bacterium]|nr:MAG: sodium:calcium symporter [Cytophagales bacterium]TAF62495.1 MAG: sodium:calcium symporter [Cytophagales bacterium]